jgi:endoglycosylceramidase
MNRVLSRPSSPHPTANDDSAARAAIRALAACVALAPCLAACGADYPSSGGPAPTTCALTLPALPDARLRANGASIEDALGRVVTLRGVNAGGRSKLTPYAPFDFKDGAYGEALDAYLDRAASWGINVLRVPFTWAAVEPTEGAVDEAFLARYDALIDGAFQRGLYTIVDFHQDIYAENLCGDGFPSWTLPEPRPAPHHDCVSWGSKYLSDDAVRGAFDAFWAEGSKVRAAYEALWDRMAKRYAGRPGVIGFEVMNEPGWGTADLARFEETTLTAFYTTMAARIHAVAPQALVFIDAVSVDAVTVSTNLARPAGAGLVFAPHYYQFAALSGGEPDPDRARVDLENWSAYGTRWSMPVFVGEFGIVNDATATAAYLGAHFAAFDALSIGGAAWEYSTATELWNGEDLSLVRADGTENPSAAGIIRPYARAVAGADVSFAYDAATRGAVLRYAPTEGISEITLPARLYPAGYAVTVTGGCADGARATRLLVKADPGSRAVEVRITAK